MKKIDFRNIVTALVAAVLNRAILLMMNPFGMAYFAGAYLYKPGRMFVVVASVIGMATALPLRILIKYTAVMLGIVLITKLLELLKIVMSPGKMALLCGSLMSIAEFAYSVGLNGTASPNGWSLLALSLAEGVASAGMVLVFNRAIRILLYHKKENILSNEEQIALGLTMALCVFAFRNYLLNSHSVLESLILFVVLYVGYCYGAGGGAITGACIGSVMAYQQSDISLLGYMAMLGIVAGAFREKGRLLSVLIYISGVVCAGLLGVSSFLEVSHLVGLVAASVVFVLLPQSFVVWRKKIAENGDYGEWSAGQMTHHRLKAFSDAFKKLAGSFYEGVVPRSCLSKEEMEAAFDELTGNVCGECSRNSKCWQQDYEETFHVTSNVLDYCAKNGTVERSLLPVSFQRRCMHVDHFLNETARVMEVARLNLNWQNRMMESRLAIAGQLGEVADIIENFSGELKEEGHADVWEADALRQRLALSKVMVKYLTVGKMPGGRRCIYMSARMRRGRCMTTREICDVIKEVCGREFVLAKGCRMVISKEFNTYEFVEDVSLKTICGIAKATKNKEDVSGDNFTFIPLADGQMALSLSDGMGSGQKASEDSEYIIGLLEQLLETGFSKQSAVRLINSMMFLKSDRQAFSTVDMSIIDLYSGMCEFVKVGASTTFIKHKSRVEAIRSQSLPMGAFTQVDYEGATRKLTDGDLVVMVTDGILNHLEGDDKDGIMAEYIEQLDGSNPQDAANDVLKFAMAGSGYRLEDDMTVLTCGVYAKS